MRTAKEALAFFLAKDSNKVNMCLYECQSAYESPHMFPSAIEQWRGAKKRHPGSHQIPMGAPGYFNSPTSKYGHIALYAGGGRWRSTDANGRGQMGTVSAEWFARNWGYTYLGWSGDIGGQDITFGREKIVVRVARLKPGVDDSNSVRMLRLALIRRGFLKVHAPLSVHRPGNKYTTAVTAAVKKWQKKKGYKPTGILTNAQAERFFAPNKRVRVIPK